MIEIILFDDDAHRDQVIELWRNVFAYDSAHNGPAVAIAKKRQFDDGLFFVACEQGTVLGTAMAGYDGHRGWLYSISVHPSHQRRGIGTRLVQHAEAALIKKGCMKINLQVLPHNDMAIAFYESLGYAVEPRISLGKRIAVNIPATSVVQGDPVDQRGGHPQTQ